MNISDKAVSYLRTIVPGLWAAAITWLVTQFPGIPEGLSTWLSDQTGAVVVLALALWYVIWRKLEPVIPDWLTKIVLGSSLAPTYIGTVAKQDGETVLVVDPVRDQFDSKTSPPFVGHDVP